VHLCFTLNTSALEVKRLRSEMNKMHSRPLLLSLLLLKRTMTDMIRYRKPLTFS
jgi:hypothetical protein